MAELRAYHPSLGERLQSGFSNTLARVGVEPRYARHLGQRFFGAVNDLTPVGNVTMAAAAGTKIRQGHPLQGLGMGALAVLPGAVGKKAKGMFGRAYHGGLAHDGNFDLTKAGTGVGSAKEPAVWFTRNPREADRWAWNAGGDPTYMGKAVYPANIDQKNFLSIDFKGKEYDAQAVQRAIAKAKAAGKPGIIFKNMAEQGWPASDQIAVLDPAQIKFGKIGK